MIGCLVAILSSSVAWGQDTDIGPALEKPKKAKWDPKGKAIDPYGRGDAKRKQEAWAEAVPLLVESVQAQPGCGKCLYSLGRALKGGERYEDAVSVGTLLAELYPDRGEGWQLITDAHAEDHNYVAAVEAATKFLSIEAKKTDSNMWFLRHRMLLQLGEYAAAEQWLGTAPSAGLAQPDQVCLKVQLLSAKGETVDARELWPKCDEGENVDLRRYTEGWLALAEGDQELAAKKLVLAGADDFGRLTIAYIRLDQQKPDMAHNLAVKVLEDSGWAADAQLANAEALLAMGKPTEALAEVDKGLMGDGWMEKHAAMAMDHVLLKTRGEGWPKEVAKRAALVKLKSVAAGGDYVAASLLKEQVAKVHGPSPELDAALDLPAGTSGVGRAQIAQQLAADAVLKRCFEKEKKKNPALAGQVVVDFAIGPDGTVSKAMSKSSTLSAPDLEKCTLDEVGKLKFTPAAGATETPVTYAVVYPM